MSALSAPGREVAAGGNTPRLLAVPLTQAPVLDLRHVIIFAD